MLSVAYIMALQFKSVNNRRKKLAAIKSELTVSFYWAGFGIIVCLIPVMGTAWLDGAFSRSVSRWFVS